MKIALTCDWHVRGSDLEAARSQLGALIQACVDRKSGLLCIAGDVFDRPQIGDQYASTGAVAEVAIRAVAELTRLGIEVLMIPGNHDVAGAGSEDALHVFDGMPSVTVVRGPTHFRLPLPRGGFSPTILALPWSWLGEDAAATLEAALTKTGPVDLLVGHVQVVGARMGAITCDAAPGKWQISREALAALPVRHVALGDFHARQDLADGRGGYVGALRQLNFGEEDNPAGFEIWESETNETEWVELDAAPRYATLSPDDFLGNLLPDPRFITRVRFEGAADPVERRRFEAAGIQVEQIMEREERVRRAEVPAGIVDSPHALIDLWAGTQNPPVDGARRARMHGLFDRLTADKNSQGQPQPTGDAGNGALDARAGEPAGAAAGSEPDLFAPAQEGRPF